MGPSKSVPLVVSRGSVWRAAAVAERRSAVCPGTFGSGQFGSVGNIPRLSNTAILDAVQALNPVSAITMAVGFANAHFYDTGCVLDGCLINSDQFTVEGGYSHLLSRHDQVGVVYAFQLLQFPKLPAAQIY